MCIIFYLHRSHQKHVSGYIGHQNVLAIQDISLLPLVGYNTGDIFMEFGFVLCGDEGLSSFDGENDVYVKLGVCVCHLYASC